ncbi:MAG: hypothetical protein ACE5EF_00010 [Dehalococcoidia bacterium]
MKVIKHAQECQRRIRAVSLRLPTLSEDLEAFSQDDCSQPHLANSIRHQLSTTIHHLTLAREAANAAFFNLCRELQIQPVIEALKDDDIEL